MRDPLYVARRFVHHRLYSTFFLDFLSRFEAVTHQVVEEPIWAIGNLRSWFRKLGSFCKKRRLPSLI